MQRPLFGTPPAHSSRQPADRVILKQYYEAQPAHSYFTGCSQGGHEAFIEAQPFCWFRRRTGALQFVPPPPIEASRPAFVIKLSRPAPLVQASLKSNQAASVPVSSDAQILETIQQAFARCPRPRHFTNHTHCAECAEHDAVLRSRDFQTLHIDDVGNPGWDPICFVSPQGFAYYVPALARLALAQPAEPHGWYGDQLLFHLCFDGPGNERIRACTPEQRRSVVKLLHHIVDTRAELVESYARSDDLFRAIEYWSDESDAANPC